MCNVSTSTTEEVNYQITDVSGSTVSTHNDYEDAWAHRKYVINAPSYDLNPIFRVVTKTTITKTEV